MIARPRVRSWLAQLRLAVWSDATRWPLSLRNPGPVTDVAPPSRKVAWRRPGSVGMKSVCVCFGCVCVRA